jgi:diguanylate cyclase (GGDEF)-like protein/PAS domain S-box-containing protein
MRTATLDPTRAGDGDVEVLRRLLTAQQAIASCLADLPPSAELYRQILSTVCGTLGWTFGAAWCLERADDDATEEPALVCQAVWNAAGTPQVGEFGAASLEQRFGRGRGLPGYVWATGAPAWLRDLIWDPRMTATQRATRAGLRSAVALPLGTATELEGVLEFFSDEERGPDGEVLAWLGVVAAQIGQYLARWRTHQTLLGRERALAAAVNGVVISDARRPGFPVKWVNPGFTRITGFTLEDIGGKPCSLLQDETTDPAAVAVLSRALARGGEARATLRNRRKDGSTFWNEVVLSPVVDEAGELVEYIGVQSDVTERRRAQEQAEYLAFHDELTGLANRALLRKVLDRAVRRSRAHGLRSALVFLDLDRFKEVNDGHGHAAGDEVLRVVAERLRAAVRPGDLLARQGGDEFLLLMADLDPDTAVGTALAAADRVRVAMADPIALAGGASVAMRCSVGVSLLGRDAEDADDLLQHAVVAMYRA